MKKLLAVLAATTVLASPALAQDAIKEFNIGILGGENAGSKLMLNPP
jgi:phosphonate transport system substrate-binding protein